MTTHLTYMFKKRSGHWFTNHDPSSIIGLTQKGSKKNQCLEMELQKEGLKHKSYWKLNHNGGKKYNDSWK